jgi:hypothetical protein
MRRLPIALLILIPAPAAAADDNPGGLEGGPVSRSSAAALQAVEPAAPAPLEPVAPAPLEPAAPAPLEPAAPAPFETGEPRSLRRADVIGSEGAALGEPEGTEPTDVDELTGRSGKPWQLELSLYALLAGMTGDVDAFGYSAEVDMSFRNLVDHLKFGAMGRARFAYERFALAVDVFYLAVTGTGINATADASQWLVEPSLGFELIEGLELLGGVRYNNLHLELRGNYPVYPTADFNFWDPFLGARGTIHISEPLSINLRADIGGFGIGSRVSWQVFPYVSWAFASWGSAEAGYRVFQTEYHTGSGVTALDYDVITYGPQLGLTLHF